MANSKKTGNRDRYPGLFSFETTDQAIFFGRDTEKKDLLQLIKKEGFVIFYSKSGLGKSSLINAGLTPLLLENDFLPMRIRFQVNNPQAKVQGGGETPLMLIKQQIEVLGKLTSQPSFLARDEPRLWELMKRCNFSESVTPVLIFDQFEEFFYYSLTDRNVFLEQLTELLHEQPPARILDALLAMPEDERTEEVLQWSKQLRVRIVIAIRADNMYQLDHLRDYLPVVLMTRYELPPLARNAARLAIVKPAAIEDQEKFSTTSFEYKEETLQLLLNGLGDDNGEVDSSQLQMVCCNIERDVMKKFGRSDDVVPAEEEREKAIVDERILPDEKAIERKLYNFYRNQLATIKNVDQRKIVTNIIENLLVADGRRTMLLDVQMMRELKNDQDLLKAMLDSKLVREEIIGARKFYEISHDKLLVPINKRIADRKDIESMRRLRREKEEAKKAAAIQKRQLNEQKLRAEEEKRRAEEEKRKAEEERENALWQEYLYHKQVMLTAQVRHNRTRARIFAGVAGFAFVVSAVLMFAALRYYHEVKVSLFKNALTLGLKYYQQNNHIMAFRIYHEIEQRGTDVAMRDSAAHFLQKANFFDVPGGDELMCLDGNRFLVLNEDNSLCLYHLDTDLSLGVDTVAAYASEYRLSADTSTVMYRDKSDSLYEYRIKDHTPMLISGVTFGHPNSKGGGFGGETSNKEGFQEMNFIPFCNFLGFINSDGRIGIVNGDAQKRVKILIRQEQNKDYLYMDIRYRLKVSRDRNHLVIWRENKLSIWNIDPKKTLVKEDSVEDVGYFYNFARPDILVYRLKGSKGLEIRPMVAGSGRSNKSSGNRRYAVATSPSFSRDGNYMIFYVGNGDMVLYDLVKNEEALVLHDIISLSAFGILSLVQNTPFLVWQERGNMALVLDKYRRLVVIEPQNRRSRFLEPAVPGEFDRYNLSPDGQYYLLQSRTSGHFVIKELASAKQLFTDTVWDFSAASDVRPVYNDAKIFFFKDTVAYTDIDSLGRLELLRKDLRDSSKRTIKTMQYNSLSAYGGAWAEFVDAGTQNSGIVLLNDQPRTTVYFDFLYPNLDDKQRTQLGLNIKFLNLW